MIKSTNFITVTTLILLILTGCGGPKEAMEKDKVVKRDETAKSVTVGPAVFLGQKGVDEAFPSPSPDGKYIAYQAREKGGNWNLFIYNIQKDTSTVLYESSGNDQFPIYSPDGYNIVFTSDKEGMDYEDGEKSRDLYLITSTGQNPQKITNSESDNWFPSFSADGSQIIFASNRNDSEQNFYNEKSSVFSYTLKTNEVQELLLNVEYKNGPTLSPDKKQLVYMDEENKLKITDLAGKEEGRLISDDKSFSAGAVFQDKDKLFYHNFSDDKFEIREYNLSGDSSRTVISNLKNSRSPRLLGKKLYFHSNEKGDYDIYLFEIK